MRQRDVDVLQVVCARATDDERTAGRVSGVGHPNPLGGRRSALREFQRDRKRKMVLPRFGYRKSGRVARYRHDECHEKSCGSERAAKGMCERRETAQRLDFKAFATTLRSATSDS